MRISGPAASKDVTPRKKVRSSQGQGGFAVSAPEVTETAAPSPAGGTSSLGSVDALLALQAVPDQSAGKKRAFRRAESMLDILDDIKLGLLSGSIPLSKLQQLVSVVQSDGERIADPHLAGILDEIELRARVEIAKVEKMMEKQS